MAVTNALSSIVIVGAMLQTVHIDGVPSHGQVCSGRLQYFLPASIFLVALRSQSECAMFKPKEKKAKPARVMQGVRMDDMLQMNWITQHADWFYLVGRCCLS